MRRFAIFILFFSMLVIGTDCVAQKKQIMKGIGAAIGVGMYRGIQVPPIAVDRYLATDRYSAVNRYSAVGRYHLPVPGYSPKVYHRQQDSLKKADLRDSISRLVKLPSPEELLKRRQEAMLKKAKAQLKAVYQKQCAEMEQGKVLRDTLAWVRLGNKAAELGTDSIAKDCFNRFLSYCPSISKIATAVDSLMNSSQPYVSAMIGSFIDYEFCKYWENSDSTKIGVSDFEILARLGDKYNSYYTDLARGMYYYLDGSYDYASDLFIGAAAHAYTDFVRYSQECRDVLFDVTVYCMFVAERYSDMLVLFESEELDRYVANNPYLAFLLYEASLFTADSVNIQKYAAMGLSADEKYFMELFQKLYDAVYADFIENPQPLSNLDFLFGGLDSTQLSQRYIDIACELVDKLPETPDDGMEHYYDEALTPYREALLEIAERADSLAEGRLTPDNALVKILAECGRAGFLSSAKQGQANFKTLFEQLCEKCDSSEYYVAIVLSGVGYSEGLSYQKPKEALKVMNKALPVIKKLDAQDTNPLGTEYVAELYEYMADLYRRIDKPKKAKKMQELANECITAVD